MSERIGSTVRFGGITYKFGSEADAIGFDECINSPGGRPGSCAVEWRCIERIQDEPEIDNDFGM
jgi:hypothetical protein